MKGETILVRRAMAPIDSGAKASLLPADSQAEALLRNIPIGEVVAVTITRERSLSQWRMFWALLDRVAAASKFETGERLYIALKVRLGYYDLMKLPNGKVVPVVHSYSFSQRDQDAAQKFIDESIRLICEEVIPGTNSTDLVREMEAVLGPPKETTA